MIRDVLALVAAILVAPCTPLLAQDAKPSEPPPPPPPPITEKMRADAQALAPLVKSDLAKQFLAATAQLKEPAPRTVYRNREKGIALSKRQFDALPEAEKESLTPREYPPQFYYETGYGSPLVYVRLLDLAAPHMRTVERPKLLDFGFGSIGQLQLLAHCGFDAHGVDVEPVFSALYSEPGDTGGIGKGAASVHIGQWPADAALAERIGAGFSLITSKNTLKKGYIHPSPPAGQTVDPKKLVHLGVSDEAYLARVHDALLPGGVFIIYNICPPQAAPDKEYIPWADGFSPFPREMLEKSGFEVLAFDAVDQDWVIECFEKLGYAEGKSRTELAEQYFCWFTIARRKD
jgi:hypothetical protein